MKAKMELLMFVLLVGFGLLESYLGFQHHNEGVIWMSGFFCGGGIGFFVSFLMQNMPKESGEVDE